VLFVPGVSPGRWLRVWGEREHEPIDARPAEQAKALAALAADEAELAFLRDVSPGEQPGLAGVELHVIPLYEETPVVVAPRDHVLAALDEVEERDLAGEELLPGQDADAVALVAAGAGLALMPQPLARLHARRDVVARPLAGRPGTRVGLAWRRDAEDPRIDRFIGVVRGRTANSSR